MNKHYYVCYPRGFCNEYLLRWTDDALTERALQETGFERITRKAAINLAIQARQYYKTDPFCAGYADAHIFPGNYMWKDDEYFESWMLDDPFAPWVSRDGYIVERWKMEVIPK